MLPAERPPAMTYNEQCSAAPRQTKTPQIRTVRDITLLSHRHSGDHVTRYDATRDSTCRKKDTARSRDRKKVVKSNLK